MSNPSQLTKVTLSKIFVGTRGAACADVFARTALVTAMSMAGVANAQTWTGATDTDWNTASNWSGGTPAATDDAVINTGTGNQPTLGVTTPGLTSTSVSAGTLAISNSGNLVSTDVNISGSGAIENAGVITGAVSVSGTGTLTNNGGSLSGPLTLNDSGSFRAATSGTIGNLAIGGSAAATISAAAGTTLTQTGAFNTATPSGSLTFGSATDTGRVVITANGGTYRTGFSVNVAGGTLAAAGGQFAGVLSDISSTSVAAGATLDIGSIDTTVQRLGGAGTVTNSSATDRVLTLKNTSTFAGAISDGATNNLSLVRSGAGTTTLTGASGYTGSTTVEQGTLALGTGSSLASTSVTIDAGAELSTNGEHLADGTTLSNNGQFTVTGAETIGEINGSGAVTLTDPGVLTIAGAATATISNTFNGTGGLTFTNASGAHTLSGANTHTGATTLEAGGLTLSGGSAIADTGAVVVNGGVLALSNSETIGALSGTGGAIQLGSNTLTVNATSGSSDYAGTIGGTGGISKTGAGTLALSGTNTYAGNTTLTAGTVAINNAGALGADSGTVLLDGGTLLATESLTLGKAHLSTQSGTASTIAAANGKTLTLSGNVNPVGSNSVLNFGAAGQEGTVVASNMSIADSTARVNVAGGTLRVGAGEFINSGLGFIAGTSVAGAATLDMAGLLVRINNLSGTGTVNSSAGTATLQTQGTSNFGGTIADGAGTSNLDVFFGSLTLSGGNTYTGTTLLSGGNLTLEGAGALASTDVTINAGRTLTTQGGAATGLAAATALTNSGVLALTGDEEIGSIAGSGAVTLGTHTLTTCGLNSSTELSGVVSGTGGLIKSGTGQLTLSGANTYVGQTAVTAGTLDVTGSIASASVVVEDSASLIADGASLSDAAGVTLNGTGSLTVNSTTETIGSLSAAAGSTVVLNAGLTVGDAADTTVAGAISGIGALTKAGNGTLLLSGGNTYSGGTTVSAGTLQGNSTSLQGNILNNAVVNFDQSVNGTYAGAMTGSGSLIKTSTGTLLLSGANTYSGGTTVSAGTLQGNSTSLQGNILNNAMVSFDQSVNGTYAGAMTGSGSLIKTGGSTLLLSGANTYSGGTTVSAGTLQGNNTSLQGNILNNAVVNFDQAVNGTYAAAMTGSGSLIKTSAGTLLLSGANTYSGGTTVSAGTLQGNSSSLQGNILNNAMVNFDQSVNGTYAGAMSGTGGFIKSGAGRLTLSGGNTYTGSTTINDGTLAVNGSLAGDVQVNNGGRLQGTGSVGSVTLAGGGVYAPGNSIGTQVVNGDLAFNGGSTYEVETDPTGVSSDLIQVNGVATLAGQVQHIGESGTYRPLSTYTILSATGGFAGTTFAGATTDYAFLAPLLTYDLNNVYLGLLRNDVAVADFGQTSNQIATASALDSLPTGGALQIGILGLTNNEVPGALNALSGELYASANGAVLQNSQELSHSLLQRSGNQLDENKRTALPLWIETKGATRRNEGDSNTAEAIQRGSSVAVGGELAMPNDWILGGAFRFGDHRLSVDDRSSHADIDSYSFGLYGRWAQPLEAGVLRMTLGGIYGIHSIDGERDIYTTGMRQSLSSDYDASSRQVFAELGYAMDVGADIQLEPYVGLSWTQVANDSFTEKGGNAALHGDSQTESMTASTLGLRSQLPLSNGQFQLDAGLGWQHNYSDVNPEAELNFVGSSAFTVEGAAVSRDTAMLDLGASYRITPAVTVRAGYSGQFGDNVSSNGGNLTLNWDI